MTHYAFRDAAELVQRGANYSRLKAIIYREQGRTSSAPGLLLRAGAAFAKSYLLKAGFLDGRLGVVAALSAAFSAATPLAMVDDQA